MDTSTANATITQFLDTEAAFALRVTQLSDRLYEQMAQALVERGLKIVTKTMGIVQLIYSEGPASQSDIAKRLRYSHQLTAQRLAWLYKHGFADTQRDPRDGRRTLISLTATGEREGKKLQDFLPGLIAAYRDLFRELDINLDALIQRADQALLDRSISQRMGPTS